MDALEKFTNQKKEVINMKDYYIKPTESKCKHSVFIEEYYPEMRICSLSIHPCPCDGTFDDMKWCAFRYRGE